MQMNDSPAVVLYTNTRVRRRNTFSFNVKSSHRIIAEHLNQ